MISGIVNTAKIEIARSSTSSPVASYSSGTLLRRTGHDVWLWEGPEDLFGSSGKNTIPLLYQGELVLVICQRNVLCQVEDGEESSSWLLVLAPRGLWWIEISGEWADGYSRIA